MGKIHQVKVIGLKGETKTIDVANSETDFNNTTVVAFKEKLTEKFPEIKGQKYRVLFADVQLEDGENFSKYEIRHLSSLFLIVTLPGGFAL